MLPLVIERATDEHFAKMEESLRLQKQEIEQGSTGVDADVIFHEALFEAAGNKVLQGFSEIMKEFFTGLRQMRLASRERGVLALAEHEAIYDAISKGDVDRAREEMRKHLHHYMTMEDIQGTNIYRRKPTEFATISR
jgi:GntR family transcriptional repressor for pyruvate dehydrogenase complex